MVVSVAFITFRSDSRLFLVTLLCSVFVDCDTVHLPVSVARMFRILCQTFGMPLIFLVDCFKALGRGGVIIRPLFLRAIERGDPTFRRIEQNVFCNISSITIQNLDFNGAFEPPDP